MIDISKKTNCSGCAACAGVCPKQCIEMKEDVEGFAYPMINIQNCINCKVCEKVCPILNRKVIKPFNQQGVIVQNKNIKVLYESTSGGAFTAIAEEVINQGGVVFGAELSKDLTVRHIYIEKKDELSRFRNSKYVQSYVGKILLQQVKAFLEERRYVCFSGTPCQIEGLKSYLGKDYTNLITVDVVCRAVPSPLIFKKYVEYQETKMKDKIQTVRFRDKHYGYKYSTINIITREKQEKYHKGVESDPWLRAFFSNICDRPSCYECRFRSRYRVSDFTIWDCFHVGRFSKELDNDMGATRMLIHTEKGKQIFNKIKNQYRYMEVEPEEILAGVKEMEESAKPNKKRKIFFEDALVLNGTQLFEKYFPITVKVRVERIIRIICYKLGVYAVAKKIFVRIVHKY